MTVTLIAPIAMEEGLALRDSRGWPDRRRRRRRQDHRVELDFGLKHLRRSPARPEYSLGISPAEVRLTCRENRPVAQLAERRSPKPQVGGSIPSWPATMRRRGGEAVEAAGNGQARWLDKIKIALAVACVVAGVGGVLLVRRHGAGAARADGAGRPGRRAASSRGCRRRARSSSRSRRKRGRRPAACRGRRARRRSRRRRSCSPSS